MEIATNSAQAIGEVINLQYDFFLIMLFIAGYFTGLSIYKR